MKINIKGSLEDDFDEDFSPVEEAWVVLHHSGDASAPLGDFGVQAQFDSSQWEAQDEMVREEILAALVRDGQFTQEQVEASRAQGRNW